MTDAPLLPDYAGRCITGVLGSLGVGLSTPGPRLADLSASVRGAAGVVLIVVDGLGDEQLLARASLAPLMAGARLAPLTSVAPSTTAAALTSLSTGVAPGRHGLVGYRFALGDDVLGFTRAHLRGATYIGVAGPEHMPEAVAGALGTSPLVLCYHDAIDKVAHAKGLEADYDDAVAATDRLVAAIRAAVPDSVAVVVTSDHGQVDVGGSAIDLSASTDALVERRTGEGRFRWLHAHPGEARALLERASTEFESTCWVMSRRQVVTSELLGEVDDAVVARLGDVAVIPHVDAFVPDPAVPLEHRMRSRHGSLTRAEMLVPLCVVA